MHLKHLSLMDGAERFGKLDKLSSLTFLEFEWSIPPYLPSSLTHLTVWTEVPLPNYFADCLPTSLTFLELYARTFNDPVDNLPHSLTHLCLPYKFNQPIDHLPSTLTNLKFLCGSISLDAFNQFVDNLPANLTHLTFGNRFNQHVDHLPTSLTHLIFGSQFNQPVDHLPSSLTHLTLGKAFQHPIDFLPQSLSHLGLDVNYAHPMSHLPVFICIERV